MGPKRRTPFNLPSDAARKRHARHEETSGARVRRLTTDASQHATSRVEETPDEREVRLEEMRSRAATSRVEETPDEREVRLEEMRSRAATSRVEETPDEREVRLEEMRSRAATSRVEETPDEREVRLEEMRSRASTSRVEETPDEREVRLEEMRTRASTSRAKPWQVLHGAAFNYDPAIRYEDHGMVEIGAMDVSCNKCGAKKWKGETKGMCCRDGKVQLPGLTDPPEPLKSLLLGAHLNSQQFLRNIRKYNSSFQMTSFGADHIDQDTYMYGKFKVQGQVYHSVGSLLPLPNTEPKFLQIYFMGDSRDQARQRQSNIKDVLFESTLQLQEMLHEHNPYVKMFKTALEHMTSDEYKVVIRAEKTPAGEHERRFNVPTVDEVAIIIVGNEFNSRDIVLHKRTPAGTYPITRISETNRAYDPLQYPLLFPFGEDGYNFKIIEGHKVTALQFYSYRIMMRDNDFNILLRSGQLFHQYVVDMYAKIESERLLFFKLNQRQLRVENYEHLRDAMANDEDFSKIGQLTILPSTFTGGPRYMQERTQDAMTYVRNYGTPDLFITFTCNPNWNEIVTELLPGQTSNDRTDLEARVFKQKLTVLMNLLKQQKGQVFGKVRCYMYSIEWQKRGLPHAHILLWLEDKIQPNQIDACISAELPDKENDAVLFEIVSKHMMHGPCGNLNRKSPCMVDGKCSKRYPRDFVRETQTGDDGYPVYRRRSPHAGGFTFNKGNVTYDNRWVVPFCPLLSRIFNAHINVEYCNSVKAIKYICKYVNKGSDQAVFQVKKGSIVDKNDEVKLYQLGRYISSNEAVWRILEFPIHERYPTVTHLAVHLENGQRVYFNANNVIDRSMAPPMTTLTAFFQLCTSDEFASELLYCDLPRYYTWQANKTWQRRKRGIAVEGQPGIFSNAALGRVYTVHPNNSECFYLRLLLHNIRGPTSFTHLRTVRGTICETFHQACLKLGLLEDDELWNITLCEATLTDSSCKLRNLFAIILSTCAPSNPSQLWQTHKQSMAEDILHKARRQNPALELDYTNDMFNQALLMIEDKVLSMVGKTLQQLQLGLPIPHRENANRLCLEMVREMAYDTDQLALEVESTVPTLSSDQAIAYNRIVEQVREEAGGIIFLDAPGGTGKTFLINLLLAKVRSQGQIAIAVASSGIAATLLTGGRTAHSTFKLPLDLHREESPVCNISKGTGLAHVLQRSRLIVWDECTMSHKAAFEALNRTLQDLRENTRSMGGVTMVLSGDFRQTLPIIPRGTAADEIKACLKKSHLWQQVEKVSLTTNQRVRLMGDLEAGRFSKFLLDIGNGEFPMDARGQVTFPTNCNIVKTSEELLSKVFPDLPKKFDTLDGDNWLNWLCERAILAPKNDVVDKINSYILFTQMPGQEVLYKSLDTVIDQDDAITYPVEFLNSLQIPGVPPHNLVLKVGAPIMLLRNLDPPKLCNGTRLCVKRLLPHVIEARIMTGCGKLEDVFLPRIPIIPTNVPYQFKRLQFPVRLSFAMSINKAQGQSLKVAGVDLRTPCFSHGQLYVACSRVGASNNLYLLSPDGKTCNVVYPQALQ